MTLKAAQGEQMPQVEYVTRSKYEESKEEILGIIQDIFKANKDYIAAYADFITPFFFGKKFLYKTGDSLYVNNAGLVVGA